MKGGDEVARALRALGDGTVQPFWRGWLCATLNDCEDLRLRRRERTAARKWTEGESGEALAAIACWVCGLELVRWDLWIEGLRERWARLDAIEEYKAGEVLDELRRRIAAGELEVHEAAMTCGVYRLLFGRYLTGGVRMPQPVVERVRQLLFSGKPWERKELADEVETGLQEET